MAIDVGHRGPPLAILLQETDLSGLVDLRVHIEALVEEPDVSELDLLESPLFLRTKSAIMTYSGLAFCMVHQPAVIIHFLKLVLAMTRFNSLRHTLKSYSNRLSNNHFTDASITFLACEDNVITSMGARMTLFTSAVSPRSALDTPDTHSAAVPSSLAPNAAAAAPAAAAAAASNSEATRLPISPISDFDVALEPFQAPTRILMHPFDTANTRVVCHRPTCVRMDQTSFCLWDAAVNIVAPLIMLHLHINPTLAHPPFPLHEIIHYVLNIDKSNKRTFFEFGRFRPVEICLIRPTIDDLYVWAANGIAPKSRDTFAFILHHLVPSHRDDYEMWGRYFKFLLRARYPYIFMFTSWLYHERDTLSSETPMLYEHLASIK